MILCFLLVSSIGCSFIGTKKEQSDPSGVGNQKKVQVTGKQVSEIPGFSLTQIEDKPDRKVLVFELSENMEQFTKKLKEEDPFQLRFHSFWAKMADLHGFNVFGFSFKTTSTSNTAPLQLRIEGIKKGKLPGYLLRSGDNENAFDYIIAQSVYARKLKDPVSLTQVENVEVTSFSRSFSSPRTRLVIPTTRYKTIVDFSRKASEVERKDFWNLVATEIQHGLNQGKFIEMGVHCGDLHFQSVGHFHYRLEMY